MEMNMESVASTARAQTDAIQSNTTVINSSFLADTFITKHPRSQYDDIEVSACLPDSVLSTENDDIQAQAVVVIDDNHLHEHGDYQTPDNPVPANTNGNCSNDTSDDRGYRDSSNDAAQNLPPHNSQKKKKMTITIGKHLPPMINLDNTDNGDKIKNKGPQYTTTTSTSSVIASPHKNRVAQSPQDTVTIPQTVSAPTHGDGLSQGAPIYSSAQQKDNVADPSSSQQYVLVEGTSMPIVTDHTELGQCDLNAIFNIASSSTTANCESSVSNDQVLNLLSNLPATSFIVDANGSIYAIQSPADNIVESDTSSAPVSTHVVTSNLSKSLSSTANDGSTVIATETTKSAPVTTYSQSVYSSSVSIPVTNLTSLPAVSQSITSPVKVLPVTSSPPAAESLPPTPIKKKTKRRRGGGGWPKGKKRKNTEAFKIKGPKSAYLLFAKKRRIELNSENPGYTFAEITVIMGKEWTLLDTKSKEEYNALADEDKQRFMVELKEYQQTEDYQKLLQRKRNEKEAAEGMPTEENLGYIEEEFTLYCHICDQRFSNAHNRKEHLAGKQHLNKLQAEMAKQNPPPPPTPPEQEESDDDTSGCCIHCVNRVTDVSLDVSLDINTHIETFIYKHSQRELELQTLRSNLKHLKDINSQLSKELISLQEAEVKLRQDLQTMKQWSHQLTCSIDNLKMVPTLFGVINF